MKEMRIKLVCCGKCNWIFKEDYSENCPRCEFPGCYLWYKGNIHGLTPMRVYYRYIKQCLFNRKGLKRKDNFLY